MYGGCSSALVTTFLPLIAAAFVPTAHPSASTEGCVYNKTGVTWLNLNQSRGIICSSLHLHGSSYYHKLDASVSSKENQLDMIHCEAVLRGYYHLDLYDHARSNGIKSLFSSGACIISSGINCTRVVLYVNLTFYDQHNGSIIPVCALTTSDHNLECFCIHYLTLDTMVEVTTDHLMPTAESTAASSMPPDVHSQPNIGSNSPGGVHSMAAISGTASVLSVVIVILLITVAALILAFILYCKKKSSPGHHHVATDDPGSPRSDRPSLETPPPVTKSNAKMRVGRSTGHLRDLELGEVANDHGDDGEDHDFGENQVLLRSLSSPT